VYLVGISIDTAKRRVQEVLSLKLFFFKSLQPLVFVDTVKNVLLSEKKYKKDMVNL